MSGLMLNLIFIFIFQMMLIIIKISKITTMIMLRLLSIPITTIMIYKPSIFNLDIMKNLNLIMIILPQLNCCIYWKNANVPLHLYGKIINWTQMSCLKHNITFKKSNLPNCNNSINNLNKQFDLDGLQVVECFGIDKNKSSKCNKRFGYWLTYPCIRT